MEETDALFRIKLMGVVTKVGEEYIKADMHSINNETGIFDFQLTMKRSYFGEQADSVREDMKFLVVLDDMKPIQVELLEWEDSDIVGKVTHATG